MEKILVIEDDHRLQKALTRVFESEGYQVEIAGDGQMGVNAFRTMPPSVVILDLKLPVLSGRDVCQQIKEADPSLPVLVLSGKADIADKVLLLELGADDYVTKPFSPRELLARVQAAMRRSKRVAPTKRELLSFADVTVDVSKMEVVRGGQELVVTAQEFKLLKFFLLNPERVITRDELLREVWGYHNYPSTRTIDNQVLKLRQKLEEDPANPVHFKTVHRMGYKFLHSSMPSTSQRVGTA